MAEITSYEALRTLIVSQYGSLSRQLQRIAVYVVDRPHDVAFETLATIATRIEVQPSSLVRFAKQLGFSGFSQMQQICRDQLVARVTDYRARIAQLDQRQAAGALERPMMALNDFIANGVAALENLAHTIDGSRLEQVVEAIATAPALHVAGFRRSFPVAAYLAYGFGRLRLRCQLLDGTGGMLDVQRDAMAPGDVLLVISFPDYAAEAISLAEYAKTHGVRLIAITDGPLSPLAGCAELSLEVHEVEIDGFRSLVAQMCLSLSLVVSIGQRLGYAAAGHIA